MSETMDFAWYSVMNRVRLSGHEVSPRGQNVLELNHYTSVIDMRYPVLRDPLRKLNYRFMAAEALWIIEGSDKLEDLIRYNPNMAAFSDDGVTLSGAYGPRIRDQIWYVVSKLTEDRDTRQATLSIWRPNPSSSKDIPCTVAIDFKIRDDKLNLHVFMRSSDIWLGLPYDVFSFSCVAYLVCSILSGVSPGTLYLTAASSHLYEEHWDVMINEPPEELCLPVPEPYWALRPSNLIASLKILRDSSKGDVIRWWER